MELDEASFDVTTFMTPFFFGVLQIFGTNLIYIYDIGILGKIFEEHDETLLKVSIEKQEQLKEHQTPSDTTGVLRMTYPQEQQS